MNRWQRIKHALGWPPAEQRFGWDEYAEMLNYAGQTYQLFGMPSLTLGAKEEEPDRTYDSFAAALFRINPVIFACMERRRSLFSEAELQWRNLERGNLFGDQALAIYEEPWPNGSMSDLLSTMEQDASLGGNWYGVRRGNQIMRLKPDWVTILLGGQGWGDPKAVPVLYLYHPGGRAAGKDPIPFGPDEVAHYAPTKDPTAQWLGLSWLNAVVREATADKAATSHKLSYLEGGAVPNTVVKPDPQLSSEEFQKFKEIYLENHSGVEKYSTVFLGGGSSIEVIGEALGKQGTSLKEVQAIGENRICMAAGVPGIIVGASEGLEAATYSNFASAKRQFVENTMCPLWRSATAALQKLARPVPGGSKLWYDGSAIPYLQEDEKARAEVTKEKSSAAKMLFEAGFSPKAIVAAVDSGDFSQLEHTGAISVQNQVPPGQEPQPKSNGKGSPEAVPVPSEGEEP